MKKLSGRFLDMMKLSDDDDFEDYDDEDELNERSFKKEDNNLINEVHSTNNENIGNEVLNEEPTKEEEEKIVSIEGKYDHDEYQQKINDISKKMVLIKSDEGAKKNIDPHQTPIDKKPFNADFNKKIDILRLFDTFQL